MGEKQRPIVAIYKNGAFFDVEVNGEKIDRLVSFEIKVENRQGKAFPSYHVEQYLPKVHNEDYQIPRGSSEEVKR